MSRANDSQAQGQLPWLPRVGLLFFFIYVIASGVTWVEGSAGVGLSGRLTIAEALSMVLVMLFLVRAVGKGSISLRVPFQYRAYSPLMLIYFISTIFAYSPSTSAVELIVHLYIWTVSIILFNIFAPYVTISLIRNLLDIALSGVVIIALVGIAHLLFFPSWFAGSFGGLSGTFRNTGQAGAYFGLFLALFIPAVMSGVIQASPRRLIGLAIVFVALVLTFKRSFWIGVGVGFACMVIFSYLKGQRQLMVRAALALFIGIVFLSIGYLVVTYAVDNTSGAAWRFDKKMSSDAIEGLSEGFFVSNFELSRNSFLSSPVFGIGLNNARILFGSNYEVHGTYFVLLSYSGVFGLVSFLFFVYVFFKSMSANMKTEFVDQRLLIFLFSLSAFFVGVFTSWIYTYPLRKKEFWIYFFIVALVIELVRLQSIRGQVSEDISS